MDNDLYIKNLHEKDTDLMYQAFSESFEDYIIPFQMSKETFIERFIHKLRINFSLSGGAFTKDFLAGFIFIGTGLYEGKMTAYNGGTGVLPAYRGRGLTKSIYHFLFPIFQEREIAQCILEVITNNKPAIKAYQSVGFDINRYYKCFKLPYKKLKKEKRNTDVTLIPVIAPTWKTYEPFADYQPSFLDTAVLINNPLRNEKVVEAHIEQTCVAYAIYQPTTGRITQIAVSPRHRGCHIASTLIHYILSDCPGVDLTIINVDSLAADFILALSKIGFENQIDQFEMIKFL